jgi:hypothetical protein
MPQRFSFAAILLRMRSSWALPTNTLRVRSAAPVPVGCMGHDTLIFTSNGAAHTALRSLLAHHVPGFARSDWGGPLLNVDYGADWEAVAAARASDAAPRVADAVVLRALVRTMFREMFGSPISDEALAAFEVLACSCAPCREP